MHAHAHTHTHTHANTQVSSEKCIRICAVNCIFVFIDFLFAKSMVLKDKTPQRLSTCTVKSVTSCKSQRESLLFKISLSHPSSPLTDLKRALKKLNNPGCLSREEMGFIPHTHSIPILLIEVTAALRETEV